MKTTASTSVPKPSALDRFASLSHEQILRAFIRPGWNGNGWVGFGPADPLDGTPAIVQAFGFDSHEEAIEFVARWINDLAIHPDKD